MDVPRNAERFTYEDGHWWHVGRSNGIRGRAYIGVCGSCSQPFLARQKQQFCSKPCKHEAHRGPRVERLCLHCGEQITSPHARKYCSHVCACKAMHKGRPITTPSTAATSDVLFHSDNPRYSKDDGGQWWYTPGGAKTHGRTRAYIQKCKKCGGDFLCSIFHRKKAQYCSRLCGGIYWAQENPDRFKGERGNNWKGGRLIRKGYVWIWCPDHPARANTKKPYVLEHILVVEKRLGRYLLPHENVHHQNGIRDDNSESNLELWSKSQPPGQRVDDKIEWAKSFLEQYGFKVSGVSALA